MGRLLIAVPTPSLAFSQGVVDAHKPVSVQTFHSELAVEGLDKGVVRRLASHEKSSAMPR
jgi:hypothetical protein